VLAVPVTGLNVRVPASTAARIDQPWTDLATLAPGQPVSRNAVAAAVIAALLEQLERFDRDGLQPFLPGYRARDVLLGQPLSVEAGDATHSGIGAGIGDDGALLVRMDGGVRSFHAGEVSVRRR
jgi:BirA family transcriptional regulator, biotin operon repressor / biotin---[acetyl-CoA-carboxylase] ligase